MAGTLDGGSSPETSLTGYGFFSFLGIVLKFLSDWLSHFEAWKYTV